MKLTIDSTEALDDTLRVVGALYGVTLEVSERQTDHTRSTPSTGRATSAAASRSRTRTRAGRKRKQPARGRARASANGRGHASTAAVRVWARENGYEIADRGRVPASVLTAYQQAHNS